MTSMNWLEILKKVPEIIERLHRETVEMLEPIFIYTVILVARWQEETNVIK